MRLIDKKGREIKIGSSLIYESPHVPKIVKVVAIQPKSPGKSGKVTVQFPNEEEGLDTRTFFVTVFDLKWVGK